MEGSNKSRIVEIVVGYPGKTVKQIRYVFIQIKVVPRTSRPLDREVFIFRKDDLNVR